MSAQGASAGGIYIALRADTSSFNRSLATADQRAGRTERSLDDLDSRSRALKGGFLAAAAGAAALVAGLGALVNRYGEVDETFARIQARGQLSDETMQQMRETGAQLGAELPSTLADSANAMDELTRSGFSSEQAMDSLRGTTLLAIAGQMSMQEAAGVTTSVLNAWQLSASQANAVADTLASTASTTSADVRGLGQSLSYASSTAAQVGATSDEIAAWSGILSNAGQKGTRAGTSIRQALTRIIDPTAEATDALNSVGLSVQDFYDESGQLRDIESIVSMLNSSMGDLDSHERSQLLNQIFGIRGQSAIAPLLAQSEELSDTLNTSFAASIAGAIDRIDKLDEQELSPIRQKVGFDLQQGSTKQVLTQFRKQAQKQDWSSDELAKRISAGLNVSDEAAARISVDLTSDTDMSAIVDTLDKASTSGEQADAVMSTLSGRIEKLSGSLDAFFSNVYRGAAGPLGLLLDTINPIASTLSQNRGAAQAFGVALVGLTGALGTLATLAGGYIAYQKTMVAVTYAQEGAALASAGAQNALSASYWRTQGAALASRASTVGLTAAKYAGAASAYGSEAAQLALSTSYWEAQAAAVASRASSIGLAASRSAGKAVAYGSAGAEWALTTARESSLATTLATRGAQLGLTAAYYAGQGAAYAAAAGTWAMDAAAAASIPSLAGLATGLYGAAAGAVALMAPLWPLVAVAGVLAGAWLAWQNNLFGVKDVTMAVAGVVAGPLTAGLHTAEGAVNAFLHPVQTVEGLLGALPGPANAARTAFMAMTGIGLAKWLFDLAGGMDTVHAGLNALGAGFEAAGAPVRAFLHPIDTVRGVIAWLRGVDPSSIPIIGGALAAELHTAGAAWAMFTDPVGTVRDVLQWLQSVDPASIPIIGGAFETSGSVAAINAVLHPIQTVEDALTALSNLDVSDIPLIGGMLSTGMDAGKGLAEGFANGAAGKKGLIGKAAGGLAGVASKYLPGSDADTGPLSTLTKQGGALPATLASGIRAKQGVVGAAADQVAQRASDALPGAQQAKSKIGAFTDRISGLLSAVGVDVPAPSVGVPQTPHATQATAPPVGAPQVRQPRTPPATQAHAPTVAAPGVGRPETPQPTPANAPAITAPAVGQPQTPTATQAVAPGITPPTVEQPTTPTAARGVAPVVAAPAVARPETPQPTPANAPAITAPAVGQPQTPTATQATAPRITAPEVNQPKTPRPTSPNAVVDAVSNGLSSIGSLLPGNLGIGDTITQRIDAVAGQTPPASALTPSTAPTTRVRANADTRALRAEMDALSPTVGAQADFGDIAAAISPATNALTQAGAAVRSHLTQGAQQAAGVFGGMSIPGTNTTVGDAATTVADRTAPVRQKVGGVIDSIAGSVGSNVPDSLGALGIVEAHTADVEQPASVPIENPPTLQADTPGTIGVESPARMGIEQPSPIGVETPAQLPRGAQAALRRERPVERPTPPGGFERMEPTVSVQLSESPGTRGPPGPRGPTGPPRGAGAVGGGVGAAGGAGAVAAGGAGEALGAPPETAPVGQSPAESVQEPPTAPIAPTPTIRPEPARTPGQPTAGTTDVGDGPQRGGGEGSGGETGQQRPRPSAGGGRSVVIKSIDFGDTHITVEGGGDVDENALADRIQQDRREDIDELRSEINGEVELANNESGTVQGDG